MYRGNSESVNTRGDSMGDDRSPDAILADPNHIIWKIMLLCVVILGGGSLAGVNPLTVAGL